MAKEVKVKVKRFKKSDMIGRWCGEKEKIMVVRKHSVHEDGGQDPMATP